MNVELHVDVDDDDQTASDEEEVPAPIFFEALPDSPSSSEDDMTTEQEAHPTPDSPNAAPAEDDELDYTKISQETARLVDPTWMSNMKREVLSKMLELEEPAITAKMLDFLVQDGITEQLVEFITLPNSSDVSRPIRTGQVTPTLKRAYKTTMLMTSEEPSEALINFLNQTCRRIARSIIEGFSETSGGSFFHICRVLEHLLRHHPHEVYDTINNMPGGGCSLIQRMLTFVGYPPVADCVVKLVALTQVNRMSHLYAACTKSKWQFYEALSEWAVLLKIVRCITSPETNCYLSPIEHEDRITYDNHSALACTLFQDLVDKLATDDTGTTLLQHIAQDDSLVGELIQCATDAAMRTGRRRSCVQVLCFLLSKSADEEVVIFSGGIGMPMAPRFLANRLFPFRGALLAILRTHVSSLCTAILEYSHPEENDVISHPGGYSSSPFSSLRLSLIELTALLVEAEPECACNISLEMWKELLGWCFLFPHTCIYHNLYYRLLFQVLRLNDRGTVQLVVQKCKLINRLVDGFNLQSPPSPADSEGSAPAPNLTSNPSPNSLNKGFILRCCNAIRLQAQSLAPSSFLRTYLHSHDLWRGFLPTLRALTSVQTTPGLGFPLPQTYSPQYGLGLTAPVSDEPVDSSGIDHGSRYAKSLGFEHDVDFPDDDESKRRKKLKKKKKKKKKGGRKGGQDNGLTDEEVDHDMEGEDEEEEEEEDTDRAPDSTEGKVEQEDDGAGGSERDSKSTTKSLNELD